MNITQMPLSSNVKVITSLMNNMDVEVTHTYVVTNLELGFFFEILKCYSLIFLPAMRNNT